MDLNLGAFVLLPWPLRFAIFWLGVGWFLGLYKAKRDEGQEVWPAIGNTIKDGLLPPWTAIKLLISYVQESVKKK